MKSTACTDLSFIDQHRAVWKARPELRAVYRELFLRLLSATANCGPIVELGSGPGFFKEFHPSLIATDVIATRWVDAVCDGCSMPFRSESVGAIIMLDVLHHLPHPLKFMNEAARVLAPGGLVAMIEPWITPTSYLLYRYFHHEDCTLQMDIESPFQVAGKKAFDGNATIPYNVVRHFSRTSSAPLNLIRCEPFLALPYLATLGFKRQSPLPEILPKLAGAVEKTLGPLGRWNATRALLIWQKSG